MNSLDSLVRIVNMLRAGNLSRCKSSHCSGQAQPLLQCAISTPSCGIYWPVREADNS